MPAAGIQPGQRGPAQGGGHALAVGRALERGVVQQKDFFIGAELGVALEHAVAMVCTQCKGSQGVFRRELAGSPMANPARIRPVLHAELRDERLRAAGPDPPRCWPPWLALAPGAWRGR